MATVIDTHAPPDTRHTCEQVLAPGEKPAVHVPQGQIGEMS